MRLHFSSDKGRCVLKYPNEVQYQKQYFDIEPDGRVYFGVDTNIGGNSEPCSVWNGTVRRFHFNCDIDMNMTKELRKEFYRENKDLMQTIAEGIKVEYPNDCNIRGTLTEDAENAEYKLQMIANEFTRY